MFFLSRLFYFLSVLLLMLFTFFAPLKFSVPYTYNINQSIPQDFLELLFMSWPVEWGLLLLIASALFYGLSRWGEAFVFRVCSLDLWVLLWMVSVLFVFIAHGVKPVGFPSCLLFFGYGLYYFLLRSVGDGKIRDSLWLVSVMAFTLITLYGFYQQHEGLEETLKNLNQIKMSEASNPQVLSRLRGKKIFSTFVYSNTLAGYLILWVPMLAFFWKNIVRRKYFVSGGILGAAIFFVILFGMMQKFSWAWTYVLYWFTLPISAFYLLLLTRSKGALLSLLISGAFVVLFWMLHRSKKVLWIFIFTVVLFTCSFLTTPLKQKLEASWKVRMEYNQASWAMIKTHPWIGTGPGTYGTNYMHYKLSQAEEVQLAHNNFLQMASEYGVLTCIAFLGIWGSTLKNILRLPGSAVKTGTLWALGAAFLHQGMDFDWFVPGLGFFIVFFMSESASSQELKELPPAALYKLTPWIHKSLIVFASLSMLLLLFPITRLCQGLDWQEKASLRLEVGNPREAVLCFQNSLTLYPYSPQTWISLAEVFFFLGNFEKAEEAYKKSLELIPDHAMTWWKLAICIMHQNEKNNPLRNKEVLTAFQNAINYYPTNQKIQRDYHTATKMLAPAGN